MKLQRESKELVLHEEAEQQKIMQNLNTINQKRQVLKKPVKDENDAKIDKLKGINLKLMAKMKELNMVLERTLEKTE